MNRKITLILKMFISFFFIVLLLWLMRKNFDEIFYIVKTIKLWLFGMSFLLYFFIIIILSYRLKKVLSAQNTYLSLRELTSLSLIGYFFSNFMPTSVGGDMVKAYYTSKSTDKKFESFTSVFIDRMIGLFSFILIAALALMFLGKNIENKSIIWAVSLMLFLSILFTVIIFDKKICKRVELILLKLKLFIIEERIKKLYNTIHSYKNHKKVLFQAFFISLLSQVFSVFVIYLLAKSLSVNIPIGVLLLVIPVIAALSMLPISLNGLGIREGAYVYFLGGIISSEKAFAVSILWLALFLILSLLGGIMHLIRR